MANLCRTFIELVGLQGVSTPFGIFAGCFCEEQTLTVGLMPIGARQVAAVMRLAMLSGQ
jgi:hypothetical protein